jgi:hypothetical protein
MSEKIYVGNSYKNETEKGTSYQFAVSREKIEKLQGVGRRNEIAIAIEPKREVLKEKLPTHSVYFGDGDSAHKHREVQLLLSKDALLSAPPDEYGNIRLFAVSRSESKMNADLSSYSVALSKKNENDRYQFVGRGYDAATKFGETRTVGTAYKREFGNRGEDGKSYSLSLDVSKVQKLTPNEYGDARLSIIPYSVAVNSPDGAITEETRYLVAEANLATAQTPQRANIEATVSIHLKEATEQQQLKPQAGEEAKHVPTLYDCNLHAIGDSNVYKLIVQDRNPDKVGKDCADLVVIEDKYTPEMKLMSAEERTAAKAAIETSYIGKGWTNNPDMIKLSAADLTQDGLSRAIENNHTVKVIAIVKGAPEVVQENHVQLAQAAKSEGLAKWVENTWYSKQAPPQQISNIKFTDEQLAALQAGKAVKAEGLYLKNWPLAGTKVDRWVAWSNKTGKCKFYEQEPKPKLDTPEPKQATAKEQAKPTPIKEQAKQAPTKAKKGMKIS